MKRASSAVPKGLKLISWYCYVVAVVLILSGIISALSYSQDQWGKISGTIVSNLQDILGITYVSYVALIISLLQSTVLYVGAVLAFALLYLFVGKQLLNHKSWSRKATITLSALSLVVGLFLIFGKTTNREDVITSILGLILPAFILYYLFTAPVKSSFAKK